ncbi:MAG: hypothetical protein KF813_08885 [Trueperaceae bacterium]|nr:hypothetical protein [Trueperaceae bacterium]
MTSSPRKLSEYLAIHHDLKLVTGNIKHFRRVSELSIEPVLANARLR